MNTGDGGLFGIAFKSSVANLKGWFAFPIENMRSERGWTINENTIITGFYMYFKLYKASMVDKYFYIDNVSFVSELK